MPLAFDFLAILAAASASASDATVQPYFCNQSETAVFFGHVEDDFGLDVAVCLSAGRKARTVTIRWSGEGGGDSLSCVAAQCKGAIEYSRYTSPHLTILQLAWTKDGHVQRLFQTLERSDLSDKAAFKTSHVWEVAGGDPDEAASFPVRTDAAPLALLALSDILPERPWHRPLLVAENPEQPAP
jgi:hypothetical protein